MKKGRALSWLVLLLSVFFVMQFENVISQASRLIHSNYKMTNQVFFNQNNDFEHRAQIFSIEDAFVIVGKTAVQYIASDGRVIWEKDVSSQNVSVGAGKNTFVLAEKKAGDLFLVNKAGEILEKRFSVGAIESVRMFSDGYIGVLQKNNAFMLLDKHLKTVSVVQLPKGEVMAYGLEPNHQSLAFVILDLTRREFNSKLVFVAYNGNITSGSTISEKIVYDLKVMKDSVATLTDEGLLFFDYTGKQIGSYEPEQIISGFTMEDQMWLYLGKKDASNITVNPETEKLVQVNNNGEPIETIELKIPDVKGIEVFGNQLVAFSDKMMVILNNEGKILDTFYGTEAIMNVHTIDSHSFAIEYINYLDIYTLK